MNDIKLSLVIPTKDRYQYLIPLIKMLDGFALKHTEIVIEDNSSDNGVYRTFAYEYTASIPIVYHHTSHQLPICRNLDNGILHSSGEYVCVLGDDDAVTPLVEDYVDRMRVNGVDSVRQKTEITYKWPLYRDADVRGATLTYGHVSDCDETIDTEAAVKNVIKKGILTLGAMPCVYQGIVKRSTLDKLYAIGGTFAPGPSPDMANACSLCFAVEKHCLTEVPLFISGGSEFQGGKNAKIKSLVQPLHNVPFISDEAKLKWEQRIPFFWCKHTVWPESGIKGLEYMGKKNYLDTMDFDRLLAKCMYEGFEYRKDILSRTDHTTKVMLCYILFYVREHLAKVKRLLCKNFNVCPAGSKQIGNLMTITEAVDYLMNEYNKQQDDHPGV